MENEAWPFLMRMPKARALEKSSMEMRIPPPESGLRTAAASERASFAMKDCPAIPAGGTETTSRENATPSGNEMSKMSPMDMLVGGTTPEPSARARSYTYVSARAQTASASATNAANIDFLPMAGSIP